MHIASLYQPTTKTEQSGNIRHLNLLHQERSSPSFSSSPSSSSFECVCMYTFRNSHTQEPQEDAMCDAHSSKSYSLARGFLTEQGTQVFQLGCLAIPVISPVTPQHWGYRCNWSHSAFFVCGHWGVAQILMVEQVVLSAEAFLHPQECPKLAWKEPLTA